MAGKGSAPGERRGGRAKGVPNKANAERTAAIAASGLTPLDYMLSVLRNEDAEPRERMYAANAAAPYVHPKLANIELGNKPGEAFRVTLDNGDGAIL